MPVVRMNTLVRRLPDDLWLETPPALDVPVRGLREDSRRVEKGDLFFALPGRRQDGAAFVAEARRRGAAAVVVEGLAPVDGPGPLLRARSARRAMALIAALFYGEPSCALRLTGITGTDGKTSTAWFVQRLLTAAGRRAAALGTLGILREDGRLEPWSAAAAQPEAGARPDPARAWRPTTPDAPLFQATLARLRDAGVQDAVAEVSSHALDQERVFGSQFAVVALTHLSADHLDFHKDAAGYRAAKAKLFARETRGGPLEREPVHAVLNLDDAFGRDLAAACPEDARTTYGRDPHARVRFVEGQAGPEGISLALEFDGGALRLRTPVTGSFHMENLHAAATIAYSLSVPPRAIARAFEDLAPVPGRFEVIRAGQPFVVVVDYAHTADGLERLLAGVRQLGVGRITLVFGCGGDRDREKRGPMGEVAARRADRIIVTSDNPRSEDPAAIASAVALGVTRAGGRVEIELDRRAALARGLEGLRAGDAFVAAGKGAETIQVFADRVVPFDDRDELRRLLGGSHGGARGA